MFYDDLPRELKEIFADIKHNSTTIKCELDDALEEADNTEDFKEIFRDKLLKIINEARDAVNLIYGE